MNTRCGWIIFFAACRTGLPIDNNGSLTDVIPTECKTLDETHCKLETACAADYCDQCGCTPAPFVGCRDKNTTAPLCLQAPCVADACDPCARLDAKQCIANPACRAVTCLDQDCNGSHFVACYDPTRTPPQMTCLPPHCVRGNCHTANDCGPGSYCQPPGGMLGTCHVNDDCPGDELCLNGSCGMKRCATNGDCPTRFRCQQAGAGPHSCVRRSCLKDGECSGSFCVNNGCYTQLGICVGDG